MTRSEDSRHAPVAIIDWNAGGHHLTYLREYVLAFAERDIPTVVMSPHPPAIDPFPPSAVWMEIPTISWIRERKSTGTAIARWRYARHLAAVMREAEKSLGSRCARALLGCLYENQAKIASRVITTLGLPCAGLYLQAGVFHSGEHLGDGKLARNTRNVLRHGLLERVFMLDGEMADTVSNLSGKPVVLLPDVTDCSIVDDHPLPAQLGIPVGKRPVIGLLGHLRPSKGVTDLIVFARSEPALDTCFLLAGSCDWNDFSADEKQELLELLGELQRLLLLEPQTHQLGLQPLPLPRLQPLPPPRRLKPCQGKDVFTSA